MPKTHPKRGDLRMGEYYVAGLPCSDELYHHGILKQRWGVRRFQNSDGSLTAAGRERYGVGKVRTKLNSAKQKASKAAKSAAAYAKERNKMKHPSLMTDEELRNYTQRLIAEKNYSDALARAQSATGFGRAEKFVSDIVTAIPKAAAKTVANIPQGVVDIAQRGVNTMADAGFQRIANQIRKTNSERKLEKLQREQKIQDIQEEMDDADGSRAQQKEIEKLQRVSQLRNLQDQLDPISAEMQDQIKRLQQQKQIKDLQKALDPNKSGGGLAAAMRIIGDPDSSPNQIQEAKQVLQNYNMAQNFIQQIANRDMSSIPNANPIQNAESPAPAPQPAPAPVSQPVQNEPQRQYQMRPLESMGDLGIRSGYETRAPRVNTYDAAKRGDHSYLEPRNDVTRMHWQEPPRVQTPPPAIYEDYPDDYDWERYFRYGR